MVRLACDGTGLLEAVRAAVANLEAHIDEINALNVFPVPDGDTGSNMAATCREMLGYVREDTSVEVVAERLREGALFGARGNSGVILSQVVRGLAEGFAGKRRFNGLDLAHALALASTAAYGAVPRPVEGTMLTVIREASAVAVETAERSNDLEAVLWAATHAAARALDKTPSLLPVLREAGVVDSGGAGLLRLFEGALAYLRGEVAVPAPVRAPRIPSPMPAEFVHLETGHGYETVYLVHPFPGQLLDLDRIRGYLVRTGESVNVAGDPKAAKIHVHNGRPDLVLRQALQLGRIVNATIVDLDHQTAEVREARQAREAAPRTGHVQPADADSGGRRARRQDGRHARPARDRGRRGGGWAGRGAGGVRHRRRAAARLHRARRPGGEPERRGDPGSDHRLTRRGGRRSPEQPEREACRRPGGRDGRPTGPGRADAQRRGGDRGPPRGGPGGGRERQRRADARRPGAPSRPCS